MKEQQLKPTLITLRDAIARDIMLRIRTHVPARVLTYTPGPPALVQVEVSPQQVERDEDGNEGAREPFVLKDVPVWHLGGQTSYIHQPLMPDDTGILLICDRSIGGWRTDGKAHPPPAPWLHNLGECVFLPGFRPDSAGIPPATLGGMVLESNLIQVGVNAAQAAVLGDAFAAMWTALFEALSAHTHPVPGITPGSGATTSSASADLLAALDLIPLISTALSTKVKLE